MDTRLFTDPDHFLDQRMDYGRLRNPIIVVLLAGLMFGLQTRAIGLSIGEDSMIVEDALNALFGIEVAKIVLLYLGFCVVFHLLASALGGQSSLGKMMKGVGWAFYPFILTGLIWSVGWYLALADASFDADRRGTEGFLERELEALTAYTDQAAGEPLLIGAFLVGAAFLLVSAYLCTVVVQENAGLDRTKAAVVVGAPFAAYLAFEAVSFLG